VRGRLVLLVLGLLALSGSCVLFWQQLRYRDLAANVAWIEDRRFEALSLITVGTGSAYENPRRLGPVSAVGFGTRIALVDAGRAAAEALRGCAIRPSQPDAVFLTSLLPENSVGLDDLLYTGWLSERRSPLRVLGPPGTRALAEAVAAAQAPAVRALGDALGLPTEGARLEAQEVGDGWSEERDGLRVAAATVGTAPLPALAWRFEAGGRALVVAGSGPDPEALARFAAGSDLLAVEGFFRESAQGAIEAGVGDAERLRREADLHLPLQRAGAAAERAGVPLLVLTRLRPPPLFDEQFRTPAGAEYRGRVEVAHDCATFGSG
jgi:ribonuclease Z